MAVGDFLRPQRSPLSVYDEQMAEMLRQQSAGIGARDIAAESALGFPVGTMTSKILGNVLAGAKAKSAINRDAEADRARSLYAQYLKTGKIDGKSVDESGNIYEMTEQPMFKEEQVQSMVPSGTNEIGVPSLGRAPEVSVAQDKVRDMTALMPSPSSVGEESDPSWFDRTFGGEIKKDQYKTLNDIKMAANIDPIEALEYEEQRRKGEKIEYGVLEKDGNIFYYNKADPSGGKWIMSDVKPQTGFRVLNKEDIKTMNLPPLSGNAFYQLDTKNQRVYRTNANDGKSMEINLNTGDTTKALGKLGENFWNKLADVENQYSDSRGQIIQAKNLLQYVDDPEGNAVYTGAFAGTVNEALGLARAIGMFDGKDDPESLYGKLYNQLLQTTTFESATNEIVLAFIKNLGRNPTDLDLKFMIKTQPGITKTPEANSMILNQRMAIADGNKEYAEWYGNFADNWRTSPEAQALYGELEEGTPTGIGDTRESILRFNSIAREKLKEISEKTSKKLEVIYKQFDNRYDKDGNLKKQNNESNNNKEEEVKRIIVDEDGILRLE